MAIPAKRPLQYDDGADDAALTPAPTYEEQAWSLRMGVLSFAVLLVAFVALAALIIAIIKQTSTITITTNSTANLTVVNNDTLLCPDGLLTDFVRDLEGRIIGGLCVPFPGFNGTNSSVACPNGTAITGVALSADFILTATCTQLQLQGDIVGTLNSTRIADVTSFMSCAPGETITGGTRRPSGQVVGGVCSPTAGNGTLPIVNSAPTVCGPNQVPTNTTTTTTGIVFTGPNTTCVDIPQGLVPINAGSLDCTDGVLVNATYDTFGRAIGGFCAAYPPGFNSSSTSCPPGYVVTGVAVGPDEIVNITCSPLALQGDVTGPLNSTQLVNRTTDLFCAMGEAIIGESRLANGVSVGGQCYPIGPLPVNPTNFTPCPAGYTQVGFITTTGLTIDPACEPIVASGMVTGNITNLTLAVVNGDGNLSCLNGVLTNMTQDAFGRVIGGVCVPFPPIYGSSVVSCPDGYYISGVGLSGSFALNATCVPLVLSGEVTGLINETVIANRTTNVVCAPGETLIGATRLANGLSLGGTCTPVAGNGTLPNINPVEFDCGPGYILTNISYLRSGLVYTGNANGSMCQPLPVGILPVNPTNFTPCPTGYVQVGLITTYGLTVQPDCQLITLGGMLTGNVTNASLEIVNVGGDLLCPTGLLANFTLDAYGRVIGGICTADNDTLPLINPAVVTCPPGYVLNGTVLTTGLLLGPTCVPLVLQGDVTGLLNQTVLLTRTSGQTCATDQVLFGGTQLPSGLITGGTCSPVLETVNPTNFTACPSGYVQVGLVTTDGLVIGPACQLIVVGGMITGNVTNASLQIVNVGGDLLCPTGLLANYTRDAYGRIIGGICTADNDTLPIINPSVVTCPPGYVVNGTVLTTGLVLGPTCVPLILQGEVTGLLNQTVIANRTTLLTCAAGEVLFGGTRLANGLVINGVCAPPTTPVNAANFTACPNGYTQVGLITTYGLTVGPVCQLITLGGMLTGNVTNASLVTVNGATLLCPSGALTNFTLDVYGRVIGGTCSPYPDAPNLPTINAANVTCPPGYMVNGTVLTTGLVLTPVCVPLTLQGEVTGLLNNTVLINRTTLLVCATGSTVTGGTRLANGISLGGVCTPVVAVTILATDNQTTVTNFANGTWQIGTAQPINHTNSPSFYALYVGDGAFTAWQSPQSFEDYALIVVGSTVAGNGSTLFQSPVMSMRATSVNNFDRFQAAVFGEGDMRFMFESQYTQTRGLISTSNAAAPIVMGFQSGHFVLNATTARGVNVSAGSNVPLVDFSATSTSVFVETDFRQNIGYVNFYFNSTTAYPEIQTGVFGPGNAWITFGQFGNASELFFTASSFDNFALYHFANSFFIQRNIPTTPGSLVSSFFHNIIEFDAAGYRMYPNQSTAAAFQLTTVKSGSIYLLFDAEMSPTTLTPISETSVYNTWSITKAGSELQILYADVTAQGSPITLKSGVRFFAATLNNTLGSEANMRLDGDMLIYPGANGNGAANVTMYIATTPALQMVLRSGGIAGAIADLNFGAQFRADIGGFVSTSSTGTGGMQIEAFSDFGRLAIGKFSDGAINTTVTQSYVAVFDKTGMRMPMTNLVGGSAVALESTGNGNSYLMFNSYLDTTTLLPTSGSSSATPWSIFNSGSELQVIYSAITTLGSTLSTAPALRMYTTILKSGDPTTVNVRADSDLQLYGGTKGRANLTFYASTSDFVPSSQIVTFSGLTYMGFCTYYRRDVEAFVSTCAPSSAAMTVSVSASPIFTITSYAATAVNSTLPAGTALLTVDPTNGLRLSIPLAIAQGGIGTGVTQAGGQVIVSQASPQAHVESGVAFSQVALFTFVSITYTTFSGITGSPSLRVDFYRVSRHVTLYMFPVTTVQGATAGIFTLQPGSGLTSNFLPFTFFNFIVYITTSSGSNNPALQFLVSMDTTGFLTFQLSQAVVAGTETIVQAPTTTGSAAFGVCIGCAPNFFTSYTSAT